MATATKTPINLFATTTVKTAAKKVAEKKFINVPLLDSKISRFNILKDEIEATTAELKMIEGDIKTAGRLEYLKEYRKLKMKPESFKMVDASGAACLFICMDKYTVVDETKAEVLATFDNLVEEKLTYKINPELVEKYAATLSKLIMNCKDIEDSDKGLLIQGEKQFSVAKGSLDRLMQYEQPEQIFELINPICALKK
jgi:hypothetical protein